MKDMSKNIDLILYGKIKNHKETTHEGKHNINFFTFKVVSLEQKYMDLLLYIKLVSSLPLRLPI
ncbi:hypothetical protein IEQ34_006890 [Dendrobium chrysotoxum]|uniref:Uncharacterized protein n=1 Tax=Dendrobium chrysotoxum TaxID=161865 RepID=A0AAV7H8U7_DENCH|nr:hypothetical protein IEQ34_006890 [Dendrobium chrysotoxum]